MSSNPRRYHLPVPTCSRYAFLIPQAAAVSRRAFLLSRQEPDAPAGASCSKGLSVPALLAVVSLCQRQFSHSQQKVAPFLATHTTLTPSGVPAPKNLRILAGSSPCPSAGIVLFMQCSASPETHVLMAVVKIHYCWGTSLNLCQYLKQCDAASSCSTKPFPRFRIFPRGPSSHRKRCVLPACV